MILLLAVLVSFLALASAAFETLKIEDFTVGLEDTSEQIVYSMRTSNHYSGSFVGSNEIFKSQSFFVSTSLAHSASFAVSPTQAPTKEPAVDTLEPTYSPTKEPVIENPNPTAAPTRAPTASPTTYAPTQQPTSVVAPGITSITASSVDRTSFKVDVVGGGAGSVFCGAFTDNSALTTSNIINRIRAQNIQASFSLNSNVYLATLNFIGLDPSTQYTVYCGTATLSQVLMAADVVITKTTTATTECCRSVSVSVNVASLFFGTSRSNAIAVSIPKPITSGSLTLTLTAKKSNNAVVKLVPDTVTFSGAKTLDYFSIPQGLSVDTYQVIATKSSSPSSVADLYDINFGESSSFKVISVGSEPPTPTLRSAQFSDNANTLIIDFDSDTNRGSFATRFQCSGLFIFSGISDSSCSWQSSSRVIAQLSSTSIVVPGNTLSVKAGLLKAACPSNSDCTDWSSVAAKSVTIATTSVAVVPSVVITAPAFVSNCDTFRIDISASTGNGGRGWTNVVYSVQSNDDALSATIAAELNEYKSEISPPRKFSGSLFDSRDATFLVTVSLTNFLGQTSSAVASIRSSSTIVPATTIIGPTTVQMSRMNALRIKTDSTVVASCSGDDGKVSRDNLDVAWEVSDNSIVVTSIVSTSSKQKNIFSLDPYSLVVGHSYVFKAITTYTVNGRSSFATVSVNVVAGKVIAAISGGNVRNIKSAETVVLDASKSYDEDTGNAAGLSFAWACSQTAPSLTADCPLNVVGSSSSSSISYKPKSDAIVSGLITLTVTQGTRSAMASVTVNVLGSSAPTVSISSDFTGKINPDKRITIIGDVQSPGAGSGAWTYDYNGVALSSISSSTLEFSFLSGARSSPRLVIMENSLPAGATLTFMLSATSQSSTTMSTVVVKVNSPPAPGVFAVAPANGTELSTVFSFAATQWVDEDLPLNYAFGYVSKGSVSYVQTKSAASFAETKLPAGNDANNYVIDVTAFIFDSYNAFSTASSSSSVTVTPASSDELQSIITNLFTDASSVDDRKNSVSIAAAALNNVNCKNTDDSFCANLNRDPCTVVENTCGACFEGYISSAKIGNKMCVSIGERRLTAGDTCSSDSECSAIEVCSSGTCATAPQRCLNDCSGNGECKHYLLSNNLNMYPSQCLVGDPTCYTMCSCDDGYYGSSCQSISDLASKQSTRTTIVNNLQQVIYEEDATADAIASWVSNAKSTFAIPDEIDVEIINDALTLNYLIVVNGAQQSVSSSVLLDAVNAADDMISVLSALAINTADSIDESHVSTYAGSLVGTVNAFSGQILSEMTAGDDNISYIFDNFRVLSTYQSSDSDLVSVQLSTPLTESEEDSEVEVPVVGFTLASGVSSAAVAMVTLRSVGPQFDSLSGVESSPVSIVIADTSYCGTDGCAISMNLATFVAETYVDDVTPIITWHCDHSSELKSSACDSEPVTYQCESDADEVITTRCPYSSETPVCKSPYLDVDVCTTVSYNSTHTICECSVPADSFSATNVIPETGRRLSDSENAGYYSTTFFSQTSTVEHTLQSIVAYAEVSFDITFQLNYGTAYNIFGDSQAQTAVVEAAATAMGISSSLIEFVMPSRRLEETHRALAAASQSVTLRVQFSTIQYPSNANNMVGLYTQFKTAFLTAVSNGSFLTTVKSQISAVSTMSGVKVSPPAVTGQVPTMAPTPYVSDTSKPSRFVAIWAIFGTLLCIYFIITVYAAIRRYFKRLADAKGARYAEPMSNQNENDPNRAEEGVVHIDNSNYIAQVNQLKARLQERRNNANGSESIDESQLEVDFSSMLATHNK